MFIAITMMLFLTFLGFETGLTEIFNLIGLSYDSTTGEIGAVSFSASNFFDALFGNGDTIKGILTALGFAVGAVLVGLFTKSSVENLILLPFITGTLVLFVQTFITVMNYAVGNFPAWATAAVVIIFLPFTVGYIMSLAEFFRGTD